MGNELINCINVAHKKIWVKHDGLTAGHWDRLAPINKVGHGQVWADVQGWAFGAKQLWNRWRLLAVDWSSEGYLRIRDGLVLEGEIQETGDEENHYDERLY
jgi:hypothetical protein